MNNPLLKHFNTAYQLAPFDKIKPQHYLEGIENALEAATEEVQQIVANKDAPTFENTIEALERVGERLQRNATLLFNLNAAETTDEIQGIAQKVSPMLSTFSSEVKQNEQLFHRVEAVYNEMDHLHLATEEEKLLKETYLDFVRRGVKLDEEKKTRFKEIAILLSKHSLQFSENVLAETNEYELIIEKEDDLRGLPADVIARAASLAKERNKSGAWIFTLQAPSYLPFMEHADNRALREKLYKAYMSKCIKGDARDNQETILQMVQLRAAMAGLLGYESYAAYVLEQRMAEKPDKVIDFLSMLLEKSLPKARHEVQEIKDFMKEQGYTHALERWDWAYFSEKLRKERYDLDDELVKPYFQLEGVLEGVFKTTEKLYGLRFLKNEELPTYHEDVSAYEVMDEKNEVIALFLADFFPRKGKRGGAWMTAYRNQKKEAGQRVIPHVSIVCNFTPSTPGDPSLLTFEQVRTLFHEFGHALHGMLADTTYASLSGTSVSWDFVELPSQIMENWCYEKECLDLFARHYQTGEQMPATLILKIRQAATYHEAYATVRQISFALLDMAWHHLSEEEAQKINDVMAFEQSAFAATELFPAVEGTNMSVQFSHIFSGGYAAGYYSYKWAEVLDADAFSLFQTHGIFDKQTAASFREHILSKGGTEHPMTLYKKYKGATPDISHLLKRAGLVDGASGVVQR